MKIRIFKKLIDSVFEVRIDTEDWSENDRKLMVKYGEPEINLGGTYTLDDSSPVESSGSDSYEVVLDDVYARILSEAPFVQRFDARDYGTIAMAKRIAALWGADIEAKIVAAVTSLRSKTEFFATEEVTEV